MQTRERRRGHEEREQKFLFELKTRAARTVDATIVIPHAI